MMDAVMLGPTTLDIKTGPLCETVKPTALMTQLMSLVVVLPRKVDRSTLVSVTKATKREQLVSQIIKTSRAGANISEKISLAYGEKYELHSTDFRGLTLICMADREGQPLSAADLAAALNLTAGAVTHSVDRLEAAGHVYREPDTKDRRRVFLRPTSGGTEISRAFNGPLREVYQSAFDGFTDEELQVYIKMQASIVDGLVRFFENHRFADD